MSEEFNVFKKPRFDDSVKKVEERTYYPYTKSFENNDIVEICVNQSDAWFRMFDSAISIKGKVTKTAGDGEVKWTINAPAFLFESITYELCGKEIESVRDPGRVSTIRGYLCYNQACDMDLYTAGWNFPHVTTAPGEFHFIIPLSHLFSIFSGNDERALCGKQVIKMVRSRNDNECFTIDDNDTKAEIQIESIVLKVVHTVPNDQIKLALLQEIKKNNSIILPFMKWELHELPSLKAGAKREIWAVKTASALESPRFVIVGFQTDRSGNVKRYPTAFDNINISNIRLSLNSDYWPNERMQLDFSQNDYMQAYRNYAKFYKSFAGVKRPLLLDFVAFKTHCLFVIDCSRREESMKATTVDIKLDFEADEGFPDKTKAFCLIIHDCMKEYLPLSDIVRSIT